MLNALSKHYDSLRADEEAARQFFLIMKAIAQYAINLDRLNIWQVTKQKYKFFVAVTHNRYISAVN